MLSLLRPGPSLILLLRPLLDLQQALCTPPHLAGPQVGWTRLDLCLLGLQLGLRIKLT